MDRRTFLVGLLARVWPFCRSVWGRSAWAGEADLIHDAAHYGNAVDGRCEPAIIGNRSGLATHAPLNLFEHFVDQDRVGGHHHAARHGEDLRPAHAHGEHEAHRSRALQVLVHKPKTFLSHQVPHEKAGGLVRALHPKDREDRLAHGLQHQILIRSRGYPCRSRVAIDPTRAPRSGRVQTEIKRKGQLVHAVGHKHLAGCQPKTPRLLKQSRARDKPESLAVVARADLAQTAIAREDLLAIPCGHGDLPGYGPGDGPGYGVASVGDHAMPVQPGSELMCTWLEPFRSCFTGPTFRHVLVLVTGAILTPARRTITATLSVVGLSQAPTFTNYHRVLNRNRWCSREVARRLLRLLVTAFMPAGPVIIALDDTLERRWGARIKARGIYRDPVRSSHAHLVKASGLRWLSFMLLAPIPWADRVWALPFLTVLAPSERYARERRRRHKTLTDWARQALLQIACWLPGWRIIAVADSSFAAIALLSAVCARVCMITRLPLDARLFGPPSAERARNDGAPAHHWR